MNKIKLEILTPYGKYYSGEVDKIHVHSDSFYLGITPNHSPLVSSLIISQMILTIGIEEKTYAIGGGVIHINEGKVKLLLNSIERKDEIDIARANEARKRAEERLASSQGIDIARAKIALQRALNRINVYNL